VPELSDEKIMLRVKEGQLSELTELFERYHVKLYHFFLRMTLDGPLSEDLTQNLFYRIIRYRQSFEPSNGNFRSWVYRMARNIYADHLRQEERLPGRRSARGNSGEPEEAAERVAGEAEWAMGPEAGYTEEHFEKLDLALAQLSPDQREILVLSRYQGLKYAEISQIKDLSIAAIKVQVYRALRQLRSLYFKQS
jgi:RNA polymerase sigma factor (sigma-70 family)